MTHAFNWNFINRDNRFAVKPNVLFVVKILGLNIWLTFMSRRMSVTSFGSAFRNMKLAIFSF